jgi:hypothetical protein
VGTFVVRSGGVNSVTDQGADPAGIGQADNNGAEYAALATGCNPNSGKCTATSFFNASCYQAAAPGTLGNSGRNTLFGPRFWIFDTGVHKDGNIVIGGAKLQYQFRAEAFNVLNHPIANAINTNIDSRYFVDVSGYYSNNGGQRTMQMGFTLSF